jgi:hypothetical protein
VKCLPESSLGNGPEINQVRLGPAGGSEIDPSFGPACINPPVICLDETGSASGPTAHSDELFQRISV